MHTSEYLDRIRQLLEKDELPAGLGALKNLLQHSPKLSQVLQQSARYHALVKQIATGISSVEEANRTKDDIRKELFGLVDEIARKQEDPELRKELEAAILVIEKEKNRCGLFLWLGLGLMVLAVLAGTWLYAMRDRFWPGSFVLTVLVHGKDGTDDRILQNQGEVMLDIGTARFREGINKDGEATFKEIPGLYLDRTAKISVEHPQPYEAVHPESLYTVRKGEAIYLEVELTGLDSVFGYVRDFVTEKPLDSVEVRMRGENTYTDQKGWFVLHIPTKARQKSINLHFSNEGYQDSPLYGVFPHLQQEHIISLHPEDK